MKGKTVYTAGPISGLSYEQVLERYKNQTKRLKEMGYKVWCPMTGKTYLRNEISLKAHGLDGFPASTNKAIKKRDKWMVKDSDIILVDFSECDGVVSIGSCMELAWADMMTKHTVVIMQKDNIHRHAFVLECADIIFETEDEAMKYLEDLAKGVDQNY